jgi:hypothetical protein
MALNNLKTIASLITNSADVSPIQLLRQFISDNEYIYYDEFLNFCESKGEIVKYNEFLDLLDAEELYLFNEYSYDNHKYWTATLIEEGYVSNSLPGDWDDFGDDQIEGITSPSFGDSGQSQPMEFEPLSNAQISDDPDSEQVEDTEDEPDLPDFDTRIRHRPSRSVKELESKEPGAKLVEHDNQVGNYGSAMSKLYGLVDSWQTGAIDQPSFETELNKMSEEPTLKNSSVKIWPMVQKILAARAEKSL